MQNKSHRKKNVQNSTRTVPFFRKIVTKGRNASCFSMNKVIVGFHSRDQQPCFSPKTKEDVSIIIAFNSQRIGLRHQHGRHFIFWGHQHGGRDVM